MATLAGQRAQFTWSLNQYNQSEDSEVRNTFAKRMSKYLSTAEGNGFTAEQITQGQPYPASEVSQHLHDPSLSSEPGPSEEQALRTVQSAVDSSDVTRAGNGSGAVYGYGYRCCPDRLKIGSTDGDTVTRIAAQISTGTPDRPTLFLEIKTDQCRSLERAIHATLETRGHKISGAGAEWFLTGRDEVPAIYQFVSQSETIAARLVTPRPVTASPDPAPASPPGAARLARPELNSDRSPASGF